MHPYSYSPLLTDFYQLTMAYGYYRKNMHERVACFHLVFRKNPFKSNYAVSCGLQAILDFLQSWQFSDDDLNYLANLKNAVNERFFPDDFLKYLKKLRFTGDIYAVPEGTLVFANEPIIRIEAPLLQCQLLETPFLNIINYQTLIATKASRVCQAAGSNNVIEFGMRRAQGPDGALSASRAAYIGGCESTSNTLAGRLFDIPVRGTHAHSWVSAFPTELEAFTAYADVMPHNCVLLVDTYNTINGVKNAITVGKKLRAEGSELLAIRLDSGDMAQLSIAARKLLDEAGFEKTTILASNTLDEYVIAKLKAEGAKIDSWGVGTNLVTSYDQPALDGVYKLSALQNDKGEWEYKLKISEQEIKNSNPGRHQIRRFMVNETIIGDVIYDVDLGIDDVTETVSLDSSHKSSSMDDIDGFVDLLQLVMHKGEPVKLPSIHEIRKLALQNVSDFYKSHSDKAYPVSLEKKLFDKKQELIKHYK